DHWVVDLKTGGSAVSQDAAPKHVQLTAYQLALRNGALHDGRVTDPGPGEEGLAVGGGVLVYPGTKTRDGSTREQAAHPPEVLEEFAALLPGLVREREGPTLTARINDGCERCPVRTICPLQPEGKATTRV